MTQGRWHISGSVTHPIPKRPGRFYQNLWHCRHILMPASSQARVLNGKCAGQWHMKNQFHFQTLCFFLIQITTGYILLLNEMIYCFTAHFLLSRFGPRLLLHRSTRSISLRFITCVPLFRCLTVAENSFFSHSQHCSQKADSRRRSSRIHAGDIIWSQRTGPAFQVVLNSSGCTCCCWSRSWPLISDALPTATQSHNYLPYR